MGNIRAGETVFPLTAVHRRAGPVSEYPGNRKQSPLAVLEELGRESEYFLDQLAHNEKMAELGRLSAGIIHELNTPLSVIVSAAQLILEEEDASDNVAELVERIRLEAQRLATLTKGILSFARSEPSGMEETDVNQVLREVLAFLKYEAQKRSITVIEAYDFQLPSICADTSRLKQIFINLIMNALQAMGNTGFLTIRTFLHAEREIAVSFTDSGPGIGSDLLPFIFEPFFTTKDSQSGTGLGLYITRKLVEKFGGRITVDTVPGSGAIFCVIFPIASSW